MRRPIDDMFEPRRKPKPVPHGFVLDALEPAAPWTRPMFGCTAVYVEDKIVLILRDKPGGVDNGVWIATTREHHESLRPLFPSMRSVSVLGAGVTAWQLLPQEEGGFEEEALAAVRMVLAGDPRIGKVPKAKRPKAAKKPAPAKKKAAKKKAAR
jgi:hypothetical protein